MKTNSSISNNKLQYLTLTGHNSNVTSVAYSPNGFKNEFIY